MLRGEAGDLADKEPGAQLAGGGGQARTPETRRHAGGPSGDGRGVRNAAPGGAFWQARDGEDGGLRDHGGAGVGADQRVRAEGSPVETVRRSLPKRVAGPRHHDALHWSEVGDALAKTDATNCAPSTKRGDPVHGADGGRQIEVRRATWEQFDLEVAVWVKPAESMKTGKAHRVPLAVQALDVLREARIDARGDGLVFPGSRLGAMLGNKVVTQALRNAGIGASGHGFGSSFKDWAREHDVDELLSEFALAHVDGSATVAASARDDLGLRA